MYDENERPRLSTLTAEQLASQIVNSTLLRKSGLAKFDEIVVKTIDILREDSAAEMKEIRTERDRLESQNTVLRSDLEAGRAKFQLEHDATLARMRSEHSAALAAQQTAHQSALTAQQRAHHSELAELKARHAVDLAARKSEGEAALHKLRAEHEAALRADKSAHEAALRAEKSAHEAALRSERAERETALRAVKADSQAMLERRHNEHASESGRLRSAEAAVMTQLQLEKTAASALAEKLRQAEKRSAEDQRRINEQEEAQRTLREQLARRAEELAELERHAVESEKRVSALRQANEKGNAERVLLEAEKDRRDHWNEGRSIEQCLQDLETELSERDALLDEREAQLEAAERRLEEFAPDAQAWRSFNTTELPEFLTSVQREAVHQREGRSAEGKQAKSVEEWLFLMSHLSTKAARAAHFHDRDNYLHDIVACAATCMNWHANAMGMKATSAAG